MLKKLTQRLVQYGITVIVFISIDFFWLNFIVPQYYTGAIQTVIKDEPNLVAAVLFYLLFTLAFLELVIRPGFKSSLIETLMKAALFGACSYGTYAFTNAAVIKHFSLNIAFLETFWGILISVMTAFISRKIALKYFT